MTEQRTALKISIRSQREDEYAGLGSYCADTSPAANQRIQSLWSQFTKDSSVLLSDLEFIDAGDPVLRECNSCCFMDLLR